MCNLIFNLALNWLVYFSLNVVVYWYFFNYLFNRAFNLWYLCICKCFINPFKKVTYIYWFLQFTFFNLTCQHTLIARSFFLVIYRILLKTYKDKSLYRIINCLREKRVTKRIKNKSYHSQLCKYLKFQNKTFKNQRIAIK